MTISEFNSKSLHIKLLLLTTKGVELDIKLNMFGAQKIMVCYALEDFFVEEIFSVETREIEEVIAFNDGKRLDKYTSRTRRYLRKYIMDNEDSDYRF